MDNETPRFCGEVNESFFSSIISALPKAKPAKKFSIIDLFMEKKLQEEKKDLNNNVSIRKVNKNCKFEDDINEFIGKNKFILRNDFDEDNIDKFLLSKEKAFESPL